MPGPGPDRPEDCRLLVAITFHDSPARLPILLDVVRTLGEFPVRALDCVIVTNARDADDRTLVKRLFVLRRLLAPWFGADQSLEIMACDGFDDPLDLPWQAKPLIRDRFLDPGRAHTHFIQLEDDMRLGWRNFAYWHRHRPVLAGAGLIPSFVRVEYSAQREEICCSDIMDPINIAKKTTIAHGTRVFLAADNPYAALYLLDRPLAEEYVASRAFDRDQSIANPALDARPGWETRERAAAGLCWENPPRGFHARHVIPVDTATMAVPPEAWVTHLGNRYADADTRLGKLPVQRIIRR